MGVLLDESELPSDEFLTFYKIYENTMLCISVIMVLGTMGIIIKSSAKSVSKYKWYLIHELAWSLIFDSLATFVGAVPLLPLPCYYAVNSARHFEGGYQKVLFFAAITAVAGKVCAVAFQFEHRFYQTQAASSSYRMLCMNLQGTREVWVRAVILLTLILCATVPIFLMFADQDEARAQLSEQDPVLAKIFHDHHSTLCFASGTDAKRVMISGSLLVLGVIFFSIILVIFMYISIRNNRFSANTYRLQLMLFWSLVAQTAVFLIFMGIPGLLFVLAPIIGMRNLSKYTTYAYLFLLAHTSLDCMMILYFIKPYRVVIMKFLPISVRTPSQRSVSSTYHTKNNMVKPFLHRF